MHRGSCLCGAVTFEVDSELGEIDGCHCEQCRRWTGHFLASTDVPRGALEVHGAGHVKWYHSSDRVRRGFCAECGSSLFFDPLDREKHDWIGISMGAFDKPTGTHMALHIFTAEKGDYYEITDGLPQNEH